MKIPKHQQIKNHLKNEILSGKFENGEKFYSEAELTKKYHVSSITVIHALKELVADGYLVRYQGRGTYIARARKLKVLKFSDLMSAQLKQPKTKVLSIIKAHDPKILTKLGLEPFESYYAITRLRQTEQTPYLYQCTYMPERFITHPLELRYYTSIYQRIKEEFKINLTVEHYTETNQVALPTPLHVAKLLNISEQTPTIKQERTTTLSLSDQIVEYVCSYERWEYFHIQFESIN